MFALSNQDDEFQLPVGVRCRILAKSNVNDIKTGKDILTLHRWLQNSVSWLQNSINKLNLCKDHGLWFVLYMSILSLNYHSQIQQHIGMWLFLSSVTFTFLYLTQNSKKNTTRKEESHAAQKCDRSIIILKLIQWTKQYLLDNGITQIFCWKVKGIIHLLQNLFSINKIYLICLVVWALHYYRRYTQRVAIQVWLVFCSERKK